MSDSWIVSGLLTGGVGATIGSIVTAAIQVVGKRSESRAAAADLVTRAAGTMIDRLDRENHELREAILLLTDVLDEVLPTIKAPPDAIGKLREARKALQRAI